jgi:predicted MFS family arabinose efflux permease
LKKNLIKLIAGQACLHACMTGMRMAAPLLALRQGSSAAMVGVLLALFALTQVFLALPAGRYADKHGLKRPVMLSVLSSSLGAVMAAIWPVFPVLCVSALLSGGATGVAIIALQRHVGRLSRDVNEMRLSYSWLAIGPAISNFVGPLAAGVVIDVSGFSAAFALLAVFPWFAWFAVRRELPMPASEQAVQDPAKRAWDLLGEPGFRRLLIVNWFLSASWDMHTFVVPLLGHERGLSASAIGAILGGFALCAALIRVVLPWLTKRWQEWQVITLAMLFTCLLLALYPMAQAAWAMGMMSALLGLSLGSVQPMVMSSLHQLLPPDRQGEGLGLRLMLINASSVAMPLVFGSLGAWLGVAAVFWCGAATVGAGSRLAWGLRRG